MVVNLGSLMRSNCEYEGDRRPPALGVASRPFDKPKSGRIAVKVINHLGDEVMKVFPA